MVKAKLLPLYNWSIILACCGLIACNGNKDNPTPATKLSGKWKLEQEYRGNIYYNAAGSITSHDKYSRLGEPDEYLEIGDSTWVFLPSTSIWQGSRDGVYKLNDTTVLVKLNRSSGFNFPSTNTYTFSALDVHHVVIREKLVFNDRTYHTKWLYSR